MGTSTIAILSGGLDSITLVAWLQHNGYDVHCVTFDYGQSHIIEISYAREAATRMGLRWDCIDISSLQPLLVGSALTDSNVEIPSGNYTDEVMKLTVVPNRNAMMLSVGFAIAAAEHAEVVAMAVHRGDHTIYPDCRKDFINSFDASMALANAWSDPVPHVQVPFVDKSKAEIVAIGHELNVPFERTWSCYRGNDIHCGTCGTDVERKLAFIEAGIPDPTIYANTKYGIPVASVKTSDTQANDS